MEEKDKESEFKTYRKNAAKAARQLYGKATAALVRAAKTEGDVCRIMIDARHAMAD